MNVNMPNKKGYTAIGYAVNELSRKSVEHLLKHPSPHRLHIEYYPGDRLYCKGIIMQMYPHLEPYLPVPLMESLESSDSSQKLLAALQHDKYDVFLTCLNETNANFWYGEPYH